MKVYFVRHGETESNVANKLQDGSSRLSLKGKEQAKFLAERVSKLKIDAFLSSTYERAKETAEIINGALNKEIDFTDLFIETKVPSEIVGRTSNDPETIRIQKLWYENFGNPEWHFSDEENFHDRKKRALACLNYLISLDKENILVVTHGTFLRLIIAIMMVGENLTLEEDRKMSTALISSNTGITVCEYAENKWQIITWNDIAHLAD